MTSLRFEAISGVICDQSNFQSQLLSASPGVFMRASSFSLSISCNGNMLSIASVFMAVVIMASTISLPQCLPFEINELLLEGKDVLNRGLTNGIIEYVGNKNASIHLRLERNYPRCNGSTLTWSVTFGNNVTFERITYTFDAVSGELLEVR